MLIFYETLFDHLPVFLVLVLGVGIGLFLLIRRHIFSLFDPLLYYIVVNETFCIADVIFMHHYGLIESRYYINYMLTETALISGILQFKPLFPKEAVGMPSTTSPTLTAFFRLALPVFIGINLFVYSQRGIPLFLESRTIVYAVGGGFGILRRLSDVLLVVIMYYLLDTLRRRRWNSFEWISLAAVVLIQAFSGAKIAVLNLVFAASLFSYFNGTINTNNSLRTKRLIKRLILASVGALLIVAKIQSSGTEMVAGRQINLVGQVAARLVMSGDAFIYTYPDRSIELLPNRNPFGAMFREYLTFFRVASPEDLPRHLGAQITNQFLSQDSGFQTNEKHNLVGYLYFGFWGSILFSYIIGTIIGSIRYILPHKYPQTWVIGIPFIIIALNSPLAVNELDALHQSILNIIIIFLPMAFLVLSNFKLESTPKK